MKKREFVLKFFRDVNAYLFCQALVNLFLQISTNNSRNCANFSLLILGGNLPDFDKMRIRATSSTIYIYFYAFFISLAYIYYVIFQYW